MSEVTQGRVVPFDRLPMIFYLCSIETLSLIQKLVFEIFDFKSAVTLKTMLGVSQGQRKCHHAIERILPIDVL